MTQTYHHRDHTGQARCRWRPKPSPLPTPYIVWDMAAVTCEKCIKLLEEEKNDK